VACYDPYFRRMVHGLRRCLADGQVVFLRLHGAAQYPTRNDLMYRNDLEGHGVLVIGYDHEARTFTIADPWNPQWDGKLAGTRSISYEDLAMQCVDSSKDFYMVLAPLTVDARINRDCRQGTSTLLIKVGFYSPDAIVMDQGDQTIDSVELELRFQRDMSSVRKSSMEGRWHVGEHAVFQIPLFAEDAVGGICHIKAKAVVSGARPYQYRDHIEVSVVRRLLSDSTNYAKPQLLHVGGLMV